MTMAELRMLFIAGLLITAVLAYVVVVGGFAAVRWLRHQVDVRSASAPTEPRAAMTPLRADAERRVQLRQAAWRLRC